MMINKTFLIAEAGVNHNGNLKLAKKLIDAADACGADAVKFQTFKAEDLVTANAPTARYQKKFSPGLSQFDMLKKYELSEKQFKDLWHYSRSRHIMFLSTPFDLNSLKSIMRLNLSYLKIGSGDLTNLSLLKEAAKYKKPVILSTGMSDLGEISEAVKVLNTGGCKKITLLHCTSSYPAEFKYVNLRAMTTLKHIFGLPVGYSDHTLGIEIAIAAVAMGASVIEKHLTLDRGMDGPDHFASIEPKEFKRLVSAIRNVENSMGNGVKVPQKPELEVKKAARKSIVALCDIPKGQKIEITSLAIKRPGYGISPRYFDSLIGRKAKKTIKKNNIIKWEDLDEN